MSTIRRRGRSARPLGYTLVELLVVIMIVVLVSAVTLPVVLPALAHRHVGEATSLLQAGLIGARDAAIRADAPRGIRLLADPVYPIPTGSTLLTSTAILASNRYLAIETAPDYTEGQLIVFPAATWNFATSSLNGNPPLDVTGMNPLQVPYPIGTGDFYPYYSPPSVLNPMNNPNHNTSPGQVLMVEQAAFQLSPANPANFLALPLPPTSWFWNVRVGDKLRINNSGLPFTVVGPLTINPYVPMFIGTTPNPNFGNPELFVNVGLPGNTAGYATRSYPTAMGPVLSPPLEFLFLVNGEDDAAQGYVDSGWDGVDNDFDGVTDGVSEWQAEQWVGKPFTRGVPQNYTITRRPVPAQGAREVSLPSGAVVDLTGWNIPTLNGNLSERSRLPVDPSSGSVDILLDPSGQVVPTTTYSSPAAFSMSEAFYHFWIAERQDLHGLTEQWGSLVNPNAANTAPKTPATFLLPMPSDAANLSLLTTQPTLYLKGERALVTLNGRTGNVSTKSLDNVPPNPLTGMPGTFDVRNVNFPYIDAQLGVREAK